MSKNAKNVIPMKSDIGQSIEAISKDCSSLYSILCLLESHESIQADLVLAGSLDVIKSQFTKIWNDIDRIGEQF